VFAKLKKLARLSLDPSFVRGLRYGVAATIEHADVLRPLRVNTVVDIGANKGQFVLLARRLYPDAMVYAFEPLPGPAERFEKLFSGDDKVALHRSAIGNQSGTASMHVSRREDSSSLLPIGELQTRHFPATEEVAVANIRIARLDELIREQDIQPDALMKIDVQGYESQVIEGSANLLPLFRYIYCEVSYVPLYEGQELAPNVIERLAELGFRVRSTHYGSSAPGNPVQADVLFERT
jgi:FkbM family methyltransferase